jgi:hypothetical protein
VEEPADDAEPDVGRDAETVAVTAADAATGLDV